MKWLMGGLALAVLGVVAALSIQTTASEANEHEDDIGTSIAAPSDETMEPEGGATPSMTEEDAVEVDAAASTAEEDGVEGDTDTTATEEDAVEADADTAVSSEDDGLETEAALTEEAGVEPEAADAPVAEEDGAVEEEDAGQTENVTDSAAAEDSQAMDAALTDETASDTQTEDGATDGGVAADGTEADAGTGETPADTGVAGFLDDGECSLYELWQELGSILTGDFPEGGIDEILPAAACQEAVSMLSRTSATIEDAPPCTLAEVLDVIPGLGMIASVPDIQVASQLCMELFGSFGEDGPDIPLIIGDSTFEGSSSDDELDGGTITIEPAPIVPLP
jgi:hypothetical protein